MTQQLTVSEIAYEFQVSRDTARKRLRDAGVKPSGKRGRRDVWDLREAIPALTGGVGGDPFRRKAARQAESIELDLQRRRGVLLERGAVEREYARMTKNVAHTLEVLPDILERDCGCTPLQLARIEKSLDGLREELYARIVKPKRGQHGRRNHSSRVRTTPAPANPRARPRIDGHDPYG